MYTNAHWGVIHTILASMMRCRITPSYTATTSPLSSRSVPGTTSYPSGFCQPVQRTTNSCTATISEFKVRSAPTSVLPLQHGSVLHRSSLPQLPLLVFCAVSLQLSPSPPPGCHQPFSHRTYDVCPTWQSACRASGVPPPRVLPVVPHHRVVGLASSLFLAASVMEAGHAPRHVLFEGA